MIQVKKHKQLKSFYFKTKNNDDKTNKKQIFGKKKITIINKMTKSKIFDFQYAEN